MTTQLNALWTHFREGAAPADLAGLADDSRSLLYIAVLAFAAGDGPLAADAAARAAASDPADTVAAAAAEHLRRLDRHGRREVYTDPAAFAAFIRGGGNVELYRRLTEALRTRYANLAPSRLLDVGAGDGTALAPVVAGTAITVEAVEPSPTLAATLAEALTESGVPHRIRTMTAQEATVEPMERVDVAQSTFCLHNLASDDRVVVLRWMRSVADRVLVAEFDVAARPVPEPGWFATVVDRYARGLAEYADDGGLVAQGFLMPVMFGYFDPAIDHHEATAKDWRAEFIAAGFDRCEIRPLYDYWWAPAVLLEAS